MQSNFSYQTHDYFNFVFTDDGSVGLYNNIVGDIYHSKFGARTEAEEKFIKPLNFHKNFFKKKELNVLDICYGIGYNTKAFLNKILKLKYKGKVSIDILEYDKNLVLISPFINDSYFKTSPDISYILINLLMDEIFNNKEEVMEILYKSDNKKFIEPFYRRLIKKYAKTWCSYSPISQNKAFLHNIYYHYISQRNKKQLKHLKLKDFSIRAYFDDARVSIKSLNKEYDIIFLDAFTPAKLPTLWSLDFFEELFKHSSEDCLLVTYSNSAAVRHAMIEAGYFVGKIFDNKKHTCGTIASKNKLLIENKLDEYDLGLLKTSAGVYYKDSGLKNSSQEILEEYSQRRKLLNLESSSQYIKRNKRS